MARKLDDRRVTDDLDGGKAAGTRTLLRCLARRYEIDLSEGQYKMLEDALSYVHWAARTVATRGRKPGSVNGGSASANGATETASEDPWAVEETKVATKAKTKEKASGNGHGDKLDLAAVRTWAQANGYTVADRGRIAVYNPGCLPCGEALLAPRQARCG